MSQPKKRITVGILAHVDAGKTTLTEAMLYAGGQLRRLGRVDHGDAFLDTDALERQRGITIFSKQAVFSLGELEVTLLDTPGHVDFSAEMERVLQVLDCAILVLSGADGVQGHTETLWRLLAQYQIPTFLFVNKMDLPGAGRSALLAELRGRLSPDCVDFGAPDPAEEIALRDEALLEAYLAGRSLPTKEVAQLISARRLFPCWFGCALKLDGVAEFLRGLALYAPDPVWGQAFGAKVFKVARDPAGARLTYLKVTGGSLRVKALLRGDGWEEKADQLRLYSGEKYQLLDTAPAGAVCAVTGLSRTRPGDGLGAEAASAPPALEPVLRCQLLLPSGCDAHALLPKLRQLEEEDPLLHIQWNEASAEIRVQLMGEIQQEVLQSVIRDRFGVEVRFGPAAICYKETILAPVEGVGHFEPLRHYAEVHLLLEPLPPGSGLHFASRCGEDQLARNWQRLVLTHLAEKEHPGVLTGSPITDVKFTLVAGRAHLKHTEGGDFREATYRAVRQGLKMAQCQLLEPWYSLRLELPADCVGRAIADLQRMEAVFDPPDLQGERAVLTGRAPVAAVGAYAREVVSYTKGRGRLTLALQGYAPCHNAPQVIAAAGYDSESDSEAPTGSVFCSHGAGFYVPWDQVRRHMHVDSGLSFEKPRPALSPPVRTGPVHYAGTLEEDKELEAIFARTFGPVQLRFFLYYQNARQAERLQAAGPQAPVHDYLLADGYNLLFSWDDLKELAHRDLAAARQKLMDTLCNYQGFTQSTVILVFDAYKVPGGAGEVERYHNIYVVYTREAETADMFIEKATYGLAERHRVRVATSDGMEQLIILGHGALRVSAAAFQQEVATVEQRIRALIAPT